MKQRQLTRRAIPGVLGFVLLLGGLAAPANASPAPSAGGVPASISTAATDTGSLPATGDVHTNQTAYSYVNRATGRCLDSNYAGDVYTLGCNGGNYQRWRVESGGTILTIHNVQTGLCLDQNGQGSVYTLGCNGGSYQLWFGSGGTTANTNIVHNFYGGVLDSNYAGHVYCLPRNGGNYQNWYFTVA